MDKGRSYNELIIILINRQKISSSEVKYNCNNAPKFYSQYFKGKSYNIILRWYYGSQVLIISGVSKEPESEKGKWANPIQWHTICLLLMTEIKII
jgi:hypothetical protein